MTLAVYCKYYPVKQLIRGGGDYISCLDDTEFKSSMKFLRLSLQKSQLTRIKIRTSSWILKDFFCIINIVLGEKKTPLFYMCWSLRCIKKEIRSPDSLVSSEARSKWTWYVLCSCVLSLRSVSEVSTSGTCSEVQIKTLWTQILHLSSQFLHSFFYVSPTLNNILIGF